MPVRDTSNRNPAVTGDHGPQAPATGPPYPAANQTVVPDPDPKRALPSGPKTLQTGLVGANHVKAPPPPLYTSGYPIEFKQLTPKSRIARNQCLAQGSHLGFLPPGPVTFSS